MERLIDFIFVLYFGIHIPVTIIIDSQVMFPRWMYPTMVTDTIDWYTEEYGDTLTAYKPAWFQALIYCNLFMQFPMFFVGIYAYCKGVSKCRWVRVPLIVYSTNVVTALVVIYFHFLLHDFAADKLYAGGPVSMSERLQLVAFYFPDFIVPLMILLDTVFNPIYVAGPSLCPAGKASVKAHQQ